MRDRPEKTEKIQMCTNQSDLFMPVQKMRDRSERASKGQKCTRPVQKMRDRPEKTKKIQKCTNQSDLFRPVQKMRDRSDRARQSQKCTKQSDLQPLLDLVVRQGEKLNGEEKEQLPNYTIMAPEGGKSTPSMM